MQAVKNIIKKTFIYPLWYNYNRQRSAKKIITEWINNGRPVPPPQVYKRIEIKKYALGYKLNVFVETGTYLGETLDSCKNIFGKLISVELDDQLYKAAKIKFAGNKNISIYKGDSGVVFQHILPEIHEPCLFWLDGHYSAGITAKGELNTPIIAELTHILNHKVDSHVILIDDARCFTGDDDYPALEVLEKFIKQRDPKLKFEVKDDIIRINR